MRITPTAVPRHLQKRPEKTALKPRPRPALTERERAERTLRRALFGTLGVGAVSPAFIWALGMSTTMGLAAIGALLAVPAILVLHEMGV